MAINWPYIGGGITQRYGRPENQRHAIQVELSRKLYMNEETKYKNELFGETQAKITKAVELIVTGMASI